MASGNYAKKTTAPDTFSKTPRTLPLTAFHNPPSLEGLLLSLSLTITLPSSFRFLSLSTIATLVATTRITARAANTNIKMNIKNLTTVSISVSNTFAK